MNSKVKQAIIDRLRATKRENIESVIKYMEEQGFFSYHCHHHHHYKGGLADHAWQTYQIAMRLDAERCAKNPNAEKLDEDSIAIASLLHDICDCSGLRNIRGHGGRSAKMLKELGLKLPLQEFLAIRFHMSLGRHRDHFLYDDALKSQLRYVVHKADNTSTKLCKGCEDISEKQDDLQYFSWDSNADIVCQTPEGWYLNLLPMQCQRQNPQDYQCEIIATKEYDSIAWYGINDACVPAICVLGSGDKKSLFTLHHYHAVDDGCFFSADKQDPFIYDRIKIYSDIVEWDDYGYVACEKEGKWKLMKVTQFPKPNCEVLGEDFSSAEEALRSIGIQNPEGHQVAEDDLEDDFLFD